MKESFDLEKYERKTPFRLPDNFFDDAQLKIAVRLRTEARRRRTLRLTVGALAAAAAVAAVLMIATIGPADMPADLTWGDLQAQTGWQLNEAEQLRAEQAMQTLSYEELTEMVASADYSYFCY